MSSSRASRSFDTQRRLMGLRLGPYVMGPRLGSGGTASVYLARGAEPGSGDALVALKVIHDHLLEETDFVRMFTDEANIVARMDHPNVVRVYEFGRDGEAMYMAMEYLHGQPLSALFERCRDNGERLPYDLVAWIGARVAAGLHHAHMLTDDEGNRLDLIHRDVSPQNVFLTYDGRVKLIDFGIAKAAGRLAKTTLGRIKGKFSYMAPEQVLGREFDQRADLFALGATLYEVTVGERLFAGDDQTDTLQKLLFEEIPNPSDHVPDLPEPLARVIRLALAPEVVDRYADAAAIERDLNAFLAEHGKQEHQARLASVMQSRFAVEISLRLKEIAKLREVAHDAHGSGHPPPVPGPRPAINTLNNGAQAVSVPAVSARSPRFLLAGLALAVTVIAGAGVVLLLRGRPSTEAPVATATPETVVFDVTVQPVVEAKITVNGAVIDGRPARATVPRGRDPVEVVVSADGYAIARIAAIPDRDQSLIVPLIKQEPPVPASASGATPATSRSGGKPPPSLPKLPVKPPPAGTATGSLVTDYPF